MSPPLFAAKKSDDAPPVPSQRAWAAAQRRAPSYVDVQRMALDYTQLSGSQPQRWVKRARRSAWLPRLQFGVRRNSDSALDLNIADKVSVSGSGVVIGPRASTFSEQADRNVTLDVRLMWELDRLVFSTDELNISREARAQRKERRELLEEVNVALSEWLHWSAVPRSARSVARKTHAQAQLDALTGGMFSARLQEGS